MLGLKEDSCCAMEKCCEFEGSMPGRVDCVCVRGAYVGVRCADGVYVAYSAEAF